MAENKREGNTKGSQPRFPLHYPLAFAKITINGLGRRCKYIFGCYSKWISGRISAQGVSCCLKEGFQRKHDHFSRDLYTLTVCIPLVIFRFFLFYVTESIQLIPVVLTFPPHLAKQRRMLLCC